MFCKYCGKQVADGAKFCTSCGKELKAGAPKEPRPAADPGIPQPAADPGKPQPAAVPGKPQPAAASGASRKQARKKAAPQKVPQVKVKARFNIGHVGVVIACMMLILSLFLPNTAENKVYEAFNTIGAADRVELFFDEAASFTAENFDGELSRAVSEQYYHTFPAKSVIENITKRMEFEDIYIDPDFQGYIRERDRIADEGFLLALAVAGLACIVLIAFITALCRRGAVLIVCSVLNVIPVWGILYICHQTDIQLKGTGYIVLVAGACLLFLSALIAHMVRSNDKRKEGMRQSAGQTGSLPL